MLAPEAIRALGLLVPLVMTCAAAAVRRPGPREWAATLLATLWNAAALVVVCVAAQRFGWVRFHATGGLFLGLPVDLYIGWALLWGALPALAVPRAPLWIVAVAAFWLDLVFMPRLAPVVELAPGWLTAELLGVTAALIPAQILARWTGSDTHLAPRAAMQAVLWSVLAVVVAPTAILEATGGSWTALFSWQAWTLHVAAQILAVPAVVALASVRAFARHGRGTPLPLDPPRRLVTRGPYAFVANPMQLAMTLLLVGLGLLLRNAYVAAIGPMAAIYSAGFAAWHENADLCDRFGTAWERYRITVHAWWPRLRPVGLALNDDPTAVLWVAGGCEPCSRIGSWLMRRHPVALEIKAAEDYPGPPLRRITYEPGDGSPHSTGVAAFASALEHAHLGWAFVAWVTVLPGILQTVQLVADAVGAGPRVIEPRPAGSTAPR